MGREEEHKEWEARELLRPLLEQEVEKVLGKRGDQEFIYELLCDKEIVEKARTLFDGSQENVGMTKLQELIQQKKTTHVPAAEKRICLQFLQGIVKEALGDQKDFPNSVLYELADNKDIVNALVSLKEGFENKAGAAMLSTRLKLWNLLGNAR